MGSFNRQSLPAVAGQAGAIGNRKSSGWGLRARLTALLLSTLIPLAGLAGYWIVREARHKQADAEREVRGVAEQLAAHAGRSVATVHEMLDVLARLPAVRGRNHKEADRLFRELLLATRRLDNIFALSADGSVIGTAVHLARGDHVSEVDRPWFQAVTQSRWPIVGGFQVDRTTGNPVAVLAHPVLDEQGRLLGVVGAALRLAELGRDIAPVQTGPQTVWALIDGDGVLLLHRDPTAAAGKSLGPLAGMIRAESVVPGTDWRAVVGIPEGVVAARVRDELLDIGLPALLILLGAIGAGFWIARSTWRPLQTLAAAVRRVQAGESGVRIPVQGSGEVGEVRRAFSETLETLAARETDLRRRHGELAALVKANRAIAASLDLEQILAAIVTAAADLTGASLANLLLVEGGQLVWNGCAGPLQEAFQQETGLAPIPIGKSFSGEVAARRQVLWVPDMAGDPRQAWSEFNARHGLRCYLGVPILAGDRVLGVLNIIGPPNTSLSEARLDLLEPLAAQAAVAIENARLHEIALRRAQRLATLNDLTRTLTTTLDPQAVARTILAAAQTLIPGAAGRFWERVGEEDAFRLVASIGLREPEGGLTLRFRLGEGFTGIAAATRQPVASRDVTQDPRFINKEWAAAEGLISCIVLPLVYGDRATGSLAILTRARHDFTDEEIALLVSFASQAAIALENARLHSTAVRRGEELGALLRATRTVMAGLDLRETLDRIVTEAAQITGTPHVKVLMADQEAQVLRLGAVVGRPAVLLEGFLLPWGTGLSGIVAATGQPLYVPNCPDDPRNLYADQDRELGIRTHLGLPIKSRDEVLGVLTFNTTEPRQYSPAEVTYLASFAAQAAMAIRNARLYQEIEQHALTLDARVRERTAELEAALRAKAQFLAAMSHELRTPLNHVLGFAQLLQGGSGGALTPKQAQYVNRIQKGGEHLLGLVTDILDLSRLEGGKGGLRVEAIPLTPLIQEALVRVAVQAAQKGIEISTELDPTLPSVIADPHRLLQILSHLVGNAVKFTPAGGRVTVTTRRIADLRLQIADRETEKAEGRGQEAAVQSAIANLQSEIPGDFLEIAVTDTGIGIKDEDRERIFRGFVQVDASEAREYGGAGIGLTLVRTLVELHGGQVWAESEGLGRGTRFIVRLPLLQAPRSKRILVVEDQLPVLETFSAALEAAGYVVERAQTGRQALDALAANPPDLLALDIGLPDVDGWEVLKRVRHQEATRDLPVLVLTGLGDVQAWQAHALGANEFLAKPVSLRVLVEAVGSILAQTVPSRSVLQDEPTQPPDEPGGGFS